MKNFLLSFLFLLALFILIPACSSDDPATPDVVPGLTGTVSDANGQPLSDVAIGVIYDIPGAVQGGKDVIVAPPREKSATMIRFDLPEPTDFKLWITDYAGDHVITLVDESRPAGAGAITWNGRDEEGVPVPSGMYYAHTENDGEPGETYEVFLLYLDPADFLTAPNARTDAQGRFHIPDSLIPVGEVIEVHNELNELVDSVAISDTVRVLAVRAGDPDPVWTQVSVVYERGTENSTADLTLQ